MKIYSKISFIALLILLGTILCLIYVHFGHTNIGYDGDEVFSYMSSNSEYGYKKLATLSDNTWYPGSYFYDALTVSEGYQFHYMIPIQNQATDVHPPVYYILLHTVCSFFPKSFSMWYGISLNIILTLFCLVVLFFLIRRFTGGCFLPLLLCFLFGLTYGVINNILFIRMYVLLMLLVTLLYSFHIKLYFSFTEGNNLIPPGQLALLVLIIVLGTLSQYYFLIFLFWLAFTFCVVLILHRKYSALIQYIGTLILSGICCVILYPTMLKHIFSGYRGEEAAHKFFSLHGFFSDIQDMFGILSRQLANQHLGIVLIIMLLWTCILILCKRICFRQVFKAVLLSAPPVLYFLTITKISPYVIDRYITPIYAIIYALLSIGIVNLARLSIVSIKIKSIKRITTIIVLFFFAFLSVHRLDKNVEQSRYWFASRNAEIQKYLSLNSSCIYISADEYHWKIWNEFPSFMEYERIYYIDGQQWNPIADKDLAQMDQILIYIEDGVDLEEAKSYILNQLGYRTWDLLFESAYADGYLVKF